MPGRESSFFLAFWRRRDSAPGDFECRNAPQVVPEWFSLEQVGVCAGSDELEKTAFDPVDKQPVALDMALPAVLEHALELVVSISYMA
jgi:hypothetical protein